MHSTYARTHTCTHSHLHTHADTRTHLYTLVHKHTHTHKHTHKHKHKHTHIAKKQNILQEQPTFCMTSFTIFISSAISSSDISPGEVGARKKQFAVGFGMKLEKCFPQHSIFLLRFLPMFVKKLLNFSATSC